MPSIQVNTFNLKDLERLAVVEAVKYTKGNIQYARELLNVSKATMYRLLKVYNVEYQEIREMNDWRHTEWKTKKTL